MKKIFLLLFKLTMMLQLTAQNVGIGTTAPTEKLQVVDGNIGILNTTDAKNWRLSYVQSQDRFAIQEDAATRLTIANGGSVGIGITVPNTKAILDIGSTTKGVLFPRMTTSQKFAIATPPNGLMVYDIDKNELHQYDGTTWSAMLNGNYWMRPIASRNRITNPNDSIGIGTNSPTEWLDVNGNIRSRNSLLADNNVTAQGTVSGAALATGGNIVVVGTSFLSGDVTTNSDLIINNTAATMQLKSSSVNKGFFQLSGNNVRFGTNSGNTTGNLIMRMNGNDRVQINPAGDINIEGKITRTTVTGNAPLLPVCMGQVDASGGIINGTGNFTVTHTVGSADYVINCSQFTSTSIIMITPNNSLPPTFGSGYDSPGKLFVFGSNDFTFYFVVYNLN